MSVIASARQDYPQCPDGLYLAVAVDVLDLGVVPSELYGDKHMLRIYWQVAGETDSNGKPYEVSRRFAVTLHRKSALRQTLEAWRGRAFTEEELKGFDVDTVIGASAQVQVQNVTKEDASYANVISVLPLMRGMKPVPWPAGYVRRVDRPDYVAPKMPTKAAPQPKPEPDGVDDAFDGVPFGLFLPLLLTIGGLFA